MELATSPYKKQFGRINTELSVGSMWDFNGIELDSDSYIPKIIQHRFMARQSGEVITAEKHILLKDTSHLQVADEIAKVLGYVRVSGENDKSYIVEGRYEDHPALVFVTQGSRSRHAPTAYEHDDDEVTTGIRINRVKIEITGHRVAIKEVIKHLTLTFKEAKVSSIRWWFMGDHGPGNREMFLEPLTTQLKPEFYPGLGDPNLYLDKYLKSSSSVLMMAGVPGTGKTTMIRHLINDFSLAADIIYDANIIAKDTVFQDFLFSKSQLLIIEDADRILLPREDDNQLMARFLSVSDGIIKLPEKKMIFTTNLSDFDKVDHALTRPGRCFDILHTRELTYTEACAAAKAAGIDEPIEEKPYTLAELFNRKRNHKHRKPGF